MAFNTSYPLLIGNTLILSVTGLVEGEQYIVEYRNASALDCEGGIWIPYSPCGNTIMIDEYYNPVVVTTPGVYRVVPADPSAATQAALQTQTVRA